MKTKLDPELEFFKETFKLISRDQRKFEYRLKNHPFESSQKRILKGLLSLKKGKKQDAYDNLKCTPFANPFEEALRRYVLGLVQLNYGTFRFAVEHFQKSTELFQSISEQEFILYPSLTLAHAYGNQSNIQSMEKWLDLAEQYPTDDTYLQMLSFITNGLYLVKSEKTDKAKIFLSNKKIEKNEFYEWFKPSIEMLKFEVFFKKKDFDSCYAVLESYKVSNGYKAKSSYEYMKVLLNHLVKKTPLYAYADDFKDYPEAFHQLEVIKALSRGDNDTANRFWDILRKNNPKIYQDNYAFLGAFSLFSEALKLYANVKKPEIDTIKISEIGDTNKKLQKILELSGGTVSKDKLIELLWGEEISESTRSGLRKLISRHNKKHSHKILSRQDSYYLDKRPA